MSIHFPTFDGWEGLHRVIFINDILEAFEKYWLLGRYHQMNMLVLLSKHRQARATDPRDKCIALMGLAKGYFEKDSANFYSQSVQHIYCSTMVDIANQAEAMPLNFLAYAGYPRARDDLPSWVPDWSYSDFAGHAIPWWHLENVEDPVAPFARYSPLAGLSLEDQRAVSFRDNNRILMATGILFDEIDSYTAVNHRASGTRFPERPGDVDENSLALSVEHADYPTGESLDSVIWRTLVLDRDNFGGRVTADRWKWVFYWLFEEAARYYQDYAETGELEKDAFQESFLDYWYLFSQLKVGNSTFGEVVRQQAPADFDTSKPPPESEIHLITSAIAAGTGGRRLAVSKKGYLGVIPTCSEGGDAIAILWGCPVPVILRKHENWYEFIGTCYIHGIMQGEIVPEIQKGAISIDSFDIR